MSRPSRRTRTPIRTVEGAGGVVINHEGRVLMIRHKNGTWVFPKGHIEPGESKTQTAEREVAEEAGVSAAILDPRMTWQTDYVNPRREARRITWYLLTTDATSTVQTEALFPEGGFFPPATAMRKLAFDEDRGVLRGALKAADRHGLIAPGDLAKAVHVAATTRGRASTQRERAQERRAAKRASGERAGERGASAAPARAANATTTDAPTDRQGDPASGPRRNRRRGRRRGNRRRGEASASARNGTSRDGSAPRIDAPAANGSKNGGNES